MLLVVASLRLGIASVIFLIFLRVSSIAVIDRIRLVLIGAIQFGVMYGCYLRAFQYIPSHIVAIFSITTPIYVVLIHNFRQRSFSKKISTGGSTIDCRGWESSRHKAFLREIFGWVFSDAGSWVVVCFWSSVISRLEKAHSQVVDHSVFALLSLGGFVSVGCFSFLLTDFTNLNISLEQWQSVVYLGIVAVNNAVVWAFFFGIKELSKEKSGWHLGCFQ